MDDAAIHDLFDGLGPVVIKRMFGGKGVYHNGLIVALEVDGEILLKADPLSAPDFEREGCVRWVYQGRKGRGPTAMPYWSIPDSALDDPEELAVWTRKAYEAAQRSKSKGRPVKPAI